MNVEQLMSREIRTCSPEHRLDCAAQIMWEHDCGIVPIVDDTQRLVGVVTDRDICMAAYTKGRALREIEIREVAMKPTATVSPKDSVRAVEEVMKHHQVRRVVVTDDRHRPVGVVSLNDLARHIGRQPNGVSSEEISSTLAAICHPRTKSEARLTS